MRTNFMEYGDTVCLRMFAQMYQSDSAVNSPPKSDVEQRLHKWLPAHMWHGRLGLIQV